MFGKREATYSDKGELIGSLHCHKNISDFKTDMRLKQGEKTKKTLITRFIEVYKDFAENTSIHGIKYTVLPEYGRYEKMFWAAALISSLGAAGYITVLFWQRFTSNPTRTTIQTAFAPTTTTPFPAITLCNMFRASDSKIRRFLERLDTTTEDITDIEETFARLPFLRDSSMDSDELPKFEESKIDIIENLLNKNEYSDPKKILRKVSMNCEEMMIRCFWENRDVKCSEVFDQIFTSDGACCTFNFLSKTRKSPRYTPFYGLGSGLRVLINPAHNDSEPSSFDLVKVMIHNSNNYPGSQSNLKIVASGTVAYLQVLAYKRICSEEVLSLSTDHRQCVYQDEKKLKYFSQNYTGYTVSNCLSECAATLTYKKCGCIPYFYEFVKVLSDTVDTANCDCPSQCEEVTYNVLSTVTNFEYDKNVTTSDYMDGYPVNNRTIWLNVYFLSNRQTIYYRDLITSTIYLISSFGGIYSLFIGSSLITIVEVLYYLIRFVVNTFQEEKGTSRDLKRKNNPRNKVIPRRGNIAVISDTLEFEPTTFLN